MIVTLYQEGAVIILIHFPKNCLNTSCHKLGLNLSLPGTLLISTLLEYNVESYIGLHPTDAQYLLNERINEERSFMKYMFWFRDNLIVSMIRTISLTSLNLLPESCHT